MNSTVETTTNQEAVEASAMLAALSFASDPELLTEFVMESLDHLTAVDANILILEQDPGRTDLIHTVFRAFHTIKGSAGFLALTEAQAAAHEVETLLDKVRNGALAFNSAIADVVLAGADYLRSHVIKVDCGGAGRTPPEIPSGEPLIARVRALMSGNATPAPQTPTPTSEPTAVESKSHSHEARLVKVDTAKLDFLVDMVGEMVIAQAMIRHDSQLAAASNPAFQRNLAQLSRITTDVQKSAMSMRMVPVGQLFQKSARMVRDLARKSGKKIEIDMTGEDTELDRTIVEELSDPLMHMIRNAADHGIEMPEDRIAAGKDANARIGLKAYHQSGHIVVEISDDGRGLSRQRILAKAQERGLIQDGATLTDKEVFNLIFEPGFSTAEKVTDLSGRGVGMDVVRKQVQKLRGRVEIESRAGQGTTFFMKLPLTLAIIDGLVVGVGTERYIVPIFVVHEIFRPRPEAIFTLEDRDEMMLIREQLLPVVRLHRRFGIQPKTDSLPDSVVVVAESQGKRFCVVVDQVLGKQEVVIKNLGETFKNVEGVSGGAILGDGRVGLILDMDTIHA